MSENPFSAKPTVIEQDEQDDSEQPDPTNPGGVKEDYDGTEADGEVVDEDGEADEVWSQTPTELYGSIDQDEFWWVFITLEMGMNIEGDRKELPFIQDRFETYEELADAREETDEDVPEGIHLQLRDSNKVRYVKGEDKQNLLEWRGLA